MSRRMTSKRQHGCKKGDKVRVVGGNCFVGSVGIALEDGVSNQKVKIQTADSSTFKVKAERLIVLELGPAGPDGSKTKISPRPLGQNYHNKRKSSTGAPSYKKQTQIYEPKKEVLVRDREGEPIVWVDDKKEEPPKENKMAKKEAARKGRSEWGFD